MKLPRLRIHRLIVLVCIASFALVACGTPQQSQSHVTTIALISYLPSFEQIITGFKAGMADAGYVEGKTVVYVYNGAVKFDNQAIDDEIQKLMSQNPDAFLVLGSPPALRIKPILEKTNKSGVFAPVTNPEKLGLVKDLLKPGGRMTGVNVGGQETTKGLEWFLTVATSVKRVHIFHINADPVTKTQIELLQPVADKLKVELVIHEVKKPADATAMLSSLSKGTDGVFAVPASYLDPDFVPKAMELGIPLGSSTPGGPGGYLTGMGVDFVNLGKQAARLEGQILHGADPGTLPIEPAEFTKQLNLATANGLGMTIPDNILQQADNVIRTLPTPQATASR